MTTYLRNVGEYHNTWTGRYLPDGYVGRVTGGGSNPAVNGTVYPGATWVAASEDDYAEWRSANPGRSHPFFKQAPPLGPTFNAYLEQVTA